LPGHIFGWKFLIKRMLATTQIQLHSDKKCLANGHICSYANQPSLLALYALFSLACYFFFLYIFVSPPQVAEHEKCPGSKITSAWSE